jgi:site-specific DNA-methyltransferase (adenine-specific)
LVFADPPYNIGKDFGPLTKQLPEDEYIDWCKEWIGKVHRVLTEDGSFYVMAATQFMPHIYLHVCKTFHILNSIIWFYDSSGVQAKKRFGSLYEPILLCVKDKNNYTFNYDDIVVPARTGAVRRLIDHRRKSPKRYSLTRNPGNVWYFPRVRFRMPEYMGHPSQKPELLLERILLTSSNEGDLVLDPFAGAFTTNAVAAKLGRNSIGIEIEPCYFDIGQRRMQAVTEGEAIANKNNHGKTPQAISLYQFGNGP